MTANPGSYDEYAEGLSELARQSLAAREAGEEWPPGWPVAYSRAMVARAGFLDAVTQLATAPGATTAEVEQAAAGILGLAAG